MATNCCSLKEKVFIYICNKCFPLFYFCSNLTLPDGQTVCPCTFQIDSSCHFSGFWHYQKPVDIKRSALSFFYLILCIQKHVHSEGTNVFNSSFQTKSLNSDLQHWIGKKKTISHVVQESSAGTAHCIKLQDFLRGLCLASTTFTRDEDEVVVGFTNHCPVNIVSKCKAERAEK